MPRFMRTLTWVSVAFIVLSFLEFFFLDRATVLQLAKEDGFFETFGSICLLLSGIILLFVWKRVADSNAASDEMSSSRTVILMLALLFLFGGLEEISWGQRIFGYPTPQFFVEHNEQHEVNIHNLTIFHGRDKTNQPKHGASAWLNMDFLFSVFWLTFLLGVPLLYRSTPFGARIIRRLGIPVVACWIGWAALSIYLLSKFMEPSLSHALQNALVEIKECDLELLIVVGAFDLFVRNSRRDSFAPWYSV